jgi:hypothetical protein
LLTRRTFATFAALFAFRFSEASESRVWPNDADGDVFRHLQKIRFDFSKVYAIDFDINFKNWPPPMEAIAAIHEKYKVVELNPPKKKEEIGYVTFRLKGKLTYDWVVAVQREATALTSRYGGKCNSWGVVL